MVELHGWLTLSATYKGDDFVDEDAMIASIKELVQTFACEDIEIKSKNGATFIEVSVFKNRRIPLIDEIIAFFKEVLTLATGSYGLLYYRDNEDYTEDRHNEFQVFVMARGEMKQQKDMYLSPCVPAIEDERG